MPPTNWQTSSTDQLIIICASSEHPLAQEDMQAAVAPSPCAICAAAPVPIIMAGLLCIIKSNGDEDTFNFPFFKGGMSLEDKSNGELGRFVPPPEPDLLEKQSLLLLWLEMLLLLWFTAAAAAAAAEAERTIESNVCVDDISIKGNLSLSSRTGEGSWLRFRNAAAAAGFKKRVSKDKFGK